MMRELGTAITINPDDRAPQIVFITQHLSKQRSQILGIIFRVTNSTYSLGFSYAYLEMLGCSCVRYQFRG
jgi:hypothetical protein